MSILIDKNTKVITQGITGKTGQFHTRMCRDYANGTQLLRRRRESEEGGRGLRGHPDLRDGARKRRSSDRRDRVSVIYVPPPFAAAAIDEAVDAELDLVDLHHRRHPGARHDPHARTAMQGKKTLLLGPNCPGVITPDEIKIGIMPGHIHTQGPHRRRVALGHAHLRSGRRSSPSSASASRRAVGIGGDPVNGLKHIDVLKLFNDDPETDAVDHDRRDRRHRRGDRGALGARTT